jgi:hypothetical protein
MAIYTKHPIFFTVGGIGTESMASGIQPDRFAGGVYNLVIGP